MRLFENFNKLYLIPIIGSIGLFFESVICMQNATGWEGLGCMVLGVFSIVFGIMSSILIFIYGKLGNETKWWTYPVIIVLSIVLSIIFLSLVMMFANMF